MRWERAFHHEDFDVDLFDIEWFDGASEQTEVWTTKTKQSETWTVGALITRAFHYLAFHSGAFDTGSGTQDETWTTRSKQSETWTGRTVRRAFHHAAFYFGAFDADPNAGSTWTTWYGQPIPNRTEIDTLEAEYAQLQPEPEPTPDPEPGVSTAGQPTGLLLILTKAS